MKRIISAAIVLLIIITQAGAPVCATEVALLDSSFPIMPETQQTTDPEPSGEHTSIRGDWHYLDHGRATIEQNGARLLIRHTWAPPGLPAHSGPNYNIVATLDGLEINGTWVYLPKNLGPYRYHATVSEDGKTITVNDTEDPIGASMNIVTLRKNPVDEGLQGLPAPRIDTNRSPAYAMWIHGNSAQIEYPKLAKSIRRRADSIRVEGRERTENRFHFTIPTPVLVGNDRLSPKSVLIRFKTTGAATLRSIHVYDGEQEIFTKTDLNLNPREWTPERFNIPRPPEMKHGLGISADVEFGPGASEIEFSSAGCDFVSGNQPQITTGFNTMEDSPYLSPVR